MKISHHELAEDLFSGLVPYDELEDYAEDIETIQLEAAERERFAIVYFLEDLAKLWSAQADRYEADGMERGAMRFTGRADGAIRAAHGIRHGDHHDSKGETP